MATLIRSSLCSNSYPYSYSCPSVISPLIATPLSSLKHGSNQRSSCCPLFSSGSSRRRSYDNKKDYSSCNSRLSALYRYGYEYGITHGYQHHHYQVTQASKRARNEEDYEEEGEYKREEQRWLREEQRWIREEQRWLREETRWNAERDSLLRQISHLTHKIQDLELELEGLRDRVGSTPAVPETLSKLTALLQVLNTNANSLSTNRIVEYSGETSKPMVLEHTKSESESESQSEIHDPIPPPAAAMTPTPDSESKHKVNQEQRKKQKGSTLLRMGAEGEEVQALQEALLSLGFYSGEEDMEFSSFSSGTLSAVKTWQASIGVPEDGIITDELLERLYEPQLFQNSASSWNADQDLTISKQEANGATTGSVNEVKEVQQKSVNKGSNDVEVPRHRVFLLGENRWEEPSRLTKENGKQVSEATSRVSANKCIVCRGEGRLLCMECDGTGEPNIEPQFMEWSDEEMKCPYCEGLGYNVCDVCDGKVVA